MQNTPLTLEALRIACERMAIPCFSSRLEPTLPLLVAYLSLLVRWNKAMNLVGPTDWEDILHTLVVDSFYLAEFMESLPLPEFPETWDLGAGAGLPGIPLRLLWQKGEYTLVEAREKRALFLQTVLAACPLPGVKVMRGRAEDFMLTRPLADIVVSRAFMPFEQVLGLVRKYFSFTGTVFFLTLAPLPGFLPDGWRGVAHTEYLVKGKPRWIWALTPTVVGA